LTLSRSVVDFYRQHRLLPIEIKNEVGTISPTLVLNNCLIPAALSTASKSFARAGWMTGATVASGGYIVQTNINVGALR